jgi:hypothetical protein
MTMCFPILPPAERGARIIAGRILKWVHVTDGMGRDLTVDELAPLMRRMVENNFDELSKAAHAIHKEDRTPDPVPQQTYAFNGWM